MNPAVESIRTHLDRIRWGLIAIRCKVDTLDLQTINLFNDLDNTWKDGRDRLLKHLEGEYGRNKSNDRD